MGEIEATIKELRGKIEDLKKRSETQKHLEWPSFEGLFED